MYINNTQKTTHRNPFCCHWPVWLTSLVGAFQRMQFLHAMFCFAFCVFVFWNNFIIFFSLTRLFVSWKTCLLPEGWIANVFWCVHGYSIISTWLRTYFAWNLFFIHFNAILFLFFSFAMNRSGAYGGIFFAVLLQRIWKQNFSAVPKLKHASCTHIKQLIKSSKLIQNFQVVFPFYIITLFSYHRFSWDSWLLRNCNARRIENKCNKKTFKRVI